MISSLIPSPRSIGILSALAFSLPAHAQWNSAASVGMRQVQMTEIGLNGQPLVREQGCLPGIEFNIDYHQGNWKFGIGTQWFAQRLAYAGQLQSGAAFSSETKTTQGRHAATLLKKLTQKIDFITKLEYDNWQRAILGKGTVLGLQEHYQSWRLLAGAQSRVLTGPVVNVDAKALLVYAQHEQLHVAFDNHVYDDTTLSTRPGKGLRLALAMQADAFPKFTLSAELEYLNISRSKDVVLLKEGNYAGTLAQSQHQRNALTVLANYTF